ncbi:kh domain-containing protein [Gigaspora margarita]|uniref:Kh domain-containing protein n=1 Tax=Gigaspora margarita TaxID=4874 RepID=A0A8H4AVZ4_GIGMA|nr:kh domain-containing protein [Gigaspora margarita]
MIRKTGNSYSTPNIRYNNRRNSANGRNSFNGQNGTTSTEFRTNSRMQFGFTLLDIDGMENLKDVKFQFQEFSTDGGNFRFSEFSNNETVNKSNNLPKYIVKKAPKQYHKDQRDNDGDVIDDLVNQLKCGLLIPSLEYDSFSTSDKLEECLNEISREIKADNIRDSRLSLQKKQMRICIFFGREVFTKVNDHEFDVMHWTRFKRKGDPSLATTFSHYHFAKIIDKMDLIQQRFGLKKRVDNVIANKRSIRVIYMNEGKKNKLKLEWDEEEGIWKITRAAADIKRVSCVDIVSGSDDPDLRLSVKTQYDINWEAKLDEIVKKLQVEPRTRNWNGQWFKCNDFVDIGCECVQHKFQKQCFYNDKFQVTIETTCHDNKGKIKNEDSISVKHLSWRTNENFNFNSTVVETFDFAKEIIRFIR